MQEFDKREEESVNTGLGFEIPTLDFLKPDDILAGIHQRINEEMEQEEGADSDKAKARKKAEAQRRGGVICCCGDSNCRIGPMQNTD